MSEVSRDPKHGDIVVDAEQDGEEQDPAVVVNTPGVTANEWEAYETRDGESVTVAEDNPSYPQDASIAVVVFEEQLDDIRPGYYGDGPLALSELAEDSASLYAFPVGRLEIVGSRKPPEIPLSETKPSPYSVREFKRENKEEYIADVQEMGHVGSYPLVRPVDDGYEIIEGHTRIWTAKQAGLEHHRMRVLEQSDWDAARRFIFDHIPPIEQEEDTPDWKYYDDAEIQETIAVLYSDFGNRIFDFERVAHHAQRVDTNDIAVSEA